MDEPYLYKGFSDFNLLKKGVDKEWMNPIYVKVLAVLYQVFGEWIWMNPVCAKVVAIFAFKKSEWIAPYFLARISRQRRHGKR